MSGTFISIPLKEFFVAIKFGNGLGHSSSSTPRMSTHGFESYIGVWRQGCLPLSSELSWHSFPAGAIPVVCIALPKLALGGTEAFR